MLKTRIIPCLDVKDGRVVKGINFEGLRDAGDPVAQAQAYDAQGADELCFLDISASHENRRTLYDVVARVAEACFMPLTVGGGIREIEDIRQLLLAGADKVSINTTAVKRPEFVREAAEKFGSQCIVVAIDAKTAVSHQSSVVSEGTGEASRPSEPSAPPHVSDSMSRSGGHKRFEIFTHGGRNATGLDAIEWAQKMVAYGAGELLVTSMDRDGTKIGYDLPLTRAIADAVRVPVIASGGVGNLEHLAAGILEGHASAVLAASIFHFGEYTVQQAKDYMAQQGIPVRST